ncbi:hypothetical protein AAZX31_14G059700 [Glycine max]|uniref:Uncharacterized protein n=1 Tax=Glycine max TaxID=3847 RepID=I1M7X7_SOYBN|nr:uncharacterized protein LOC100792552 [Glycine max]KAG4962250.1 hypothetical protein JHK86_039118 [Glycine max]KAG4964724.1 hypothetical protein JHK85_039699 [Glycine max]KAH1093296.1 hypothetical protein GYH30_039173 [Glycine max]KAH1211895.1 hypothetical protein GmHk_14G040227 [Glycine max]KRH14991.1 hypothetical protein GLYMA_14G062000v4 [Glycine max]|eukprot:XP_014622420.1 uncharacterized protein LOC100792552 [Glycine max]
MANWRERDLFHIDEIDPVDASNGEDFDDSSSVDSATSDGSRTQVGLTERLTDILVDERDGDLLIQQTNREDRLLWWLQALDMQVMGACRADERLKPLLKMNASCGVAEDPLLAQLTQHFEPSEVGILARCFCVPLVSFRVGKINKEGTRFCPTSNRGNLTLVLLPSSDLRLSFIGDDGRTERLFTLTNKSQCSAVVVDEIPTDSSGRSFLVRTPDSRAFYFWCSEKSKLLGIELLGKMKDLLKRKPSIVELSGISKSRLDCFATQLRAFLVGTTGGSSHDSSVCASTSANSMSCSNVASESSHPSSSKFPRSRNIGGQTAKGDTTLYQSILSPRSSSFKEVPPRNLSSHRIAAREKIKRRGDNHQPTVDTLTNDSTHILDLSSTSDHDKASEVTKTLAFSPSFLGSLGKLGGVPSSLGLSGEVPPIVSPIFSPYYCWCPPGISTCPSIAAVTQSPNSSIETLPFPSGASLLANPLSVNLLDPVQPLGTSMDFPPFLPDPLVRMSLPTSQQIPTFTPLMCDPIVHVPVIDVCSSGQGYLVSAGPAMSPSIPPLHPNLVKPLIPESDAVVKGARETLRLLLSGSSQGNQQMMRDTLPAILTNPDENQNNILVAGSRGLYTGTRDINAIANSIAAMGLVSLSGVSKVDSGVYSELCENYGNLEAVKNSNDSGGGAFLDDEGGSSLDSKQ